MEIWAHRGRASPNQLGNSTSNFIASINLGVTGIETDICFTADKKIIVYHPGSTHPDLSKMNWRDIDNSIFHITTLSEFLNLIRADRRISCCLDIKQNSKELVEKIVWEIGYRRLQDRVFLTAFDRKMSLPFFSTETDGSILNYAKESADKLGEKIRTHLIVTWPSNIPKVAREYQPDMISIGWLLEPKLIRVASRSLFKLLASTRNLHKDVREMKAMGIKVLGGIVNNTQSMLYLAELGIDGIMTDDITLGMSFKEEYEKKSA